MVTVEIHVAHTVQRRFEQLVRDAVKAGCVLPSKRGQEIDHLLKRALLDGLRDLENQHAAGELY